MIKLKDLFEIQINNTPKLDYSDIGPYEAEVITKYNIGDKNGVEIMRPNTIISVCKLGNLYSCLTPGGGTEPIWLIPNQFLKFRRLDSWFKNNDDNITEWIKEKMDKNNYQVLKQLKNKVDEIQITTPSRFQVGKEYVIDPQYTNEPGIVQKLKITKKEFKNNTWMYIVENNITGERFWASEKRLAEYVVI